MVLSELTFVLLVAGLIGGMIGTVLGALQSLTLGGFAIVVGETLPFLDDMIGSDPATIEMLGVSVAPLDAVGLTGAVGFGPVLGPHVAFAGGVAAAAYAGRKGTFDTTFRYHQAKQIRKPLGVDPWRLLVGGTFGVFGVVVARLAAGLGVPADPVMLTVVVSGFTHRLVFGYLLVGRVWNLDRSVLDMSLFERDVRWGEEGYETSQGTGGRYVVEVWLPDYYQWEIVAVLGFGVGLASGLIAVLTGSVFLPFGLSVASLAVLTAKEYSTSVEETLEEYPFPVTYHMALPASIAAVAVETSPLLGLAFAAVFGVLAGLVGELSQRLFYAHGDTHLDPPAVTIVVLSLLITLLGTIGVFDPELIPYPVV